MNEIRPWQITYAGHTFTDDDLTVGDAIMIQTLAGGGWAALNPWAGPRELVAVVAAVVARLSDTTAGVVAEKLNAEPVAEVLAMLEPRQA